MFYKLDLVKFYTPRVDCLYYLQDMIQAQAFLHSVIVLCSENSRSEKTRNLGENKEGVSKLVYD